MGNSGQLGTQTHQRRWRRVWIALALCFALLVIFHRPLLLGLGRQVAGHYAGKEHLKLNFRVEGNVFTGLTVRDLHIVPSGPTDVETIDVAFLHADYSLFGLMRHGLSQLFTNVEIRSARVVLDPDKTPSKPRGFKPRKKNRPPSLFPERVKLSDATLVVRNKPHDFVLQHIDLELNPRSPGELRIATLQLPDGQSWSNISSATFYGGKILVVRSLILNDQDHIDVLKVDTSKIEMKSLDLNVEGVIGGGKVSGSVQWAERQSSLVRQIALHGQNISADALNKYVNLPEKFLGGQIEKFDADFAGKFDSPSGWTGWITAEVRDVHVQAISFDRCTVNAWAKDGKAGLESADLVQGENHIYLRGSAQLPDRVDEFGRSQATLEITAAVLDLDRLTAGTSQPMTGSAQVSGKIEIKKGKLEANLLASAGSVGFKDGTVDKVIANISASKIMAPPKTETPWFTDLRAAVNLQVSNIRYRDYVFDSMEALIGAEDEAVSLKRLNLRRKQNNLSIIGRYRLPEDFREAAAATADLDFLLKANELGDYWASDSKDKITGPLQMAGQIEWEKKIANGQMSILGSNLKTRDLILKQVSSQCSIANNVIYLNDFTASLNKSDFAGAHGIVDLRAPYHYSGKLSARVSDVATLQPLLHASGNENKLAGSLAVDWEGSGEARAFKNSGKLKLLFERGRYGNLQALRANIDATYSPDALDIPVFFLASDRMNFQTIVQAKGETLEVAKIDLNQGEAKYASGYISIPFIWKNLGTGAPVSPPDGKVVATFQSENIDIKKLFEDFGAQPLASGVLNVKLDAQGTIANLNARLDVQMRELRSERASKLDAATFDLSAQAERNQLTVSGKLQQAEIQPMELNANMPLDIPKIVRERELADATPITAKLRLPRSSVNFVRKIVPEFESLDGDMALDVDVAGTVGRPALSGSADMTVNLARFTNATLPTMRDFKARLTLAGNALTLERFGGVLAGGPFTLTGSVTFPRITSANLDLHLKADSVLIARNDALTARADADLKVVGPMTSANVTGNLAITNSQLLKNIDLIPIGLPGRPAPQPPSSQPNFSIPDPPFRDWKFDVAIKTKDAFLIRGNLANGAANCDLHLMGTGLHPGLQGQVRLKNVEATLPFSRLSISYGFLYFDPSDSLNPKVDLHGTSVVRDYIVHVFVYGTLLAPEAVFTSEPPLPQEEIISLLATGATRDQLTGDNNVLAGRAATLLVQQLYVKIFKKGQATQSNSVFDRLDLDVGQIDPRTGERRATARFKINNQFVLVGDLEVGGDFRGMLKYLIRFH